MTKIQIQPNTTLYPVPVVLVTCGKGKMANVLTLNRIASINAEPPMIGLSIRPIRASHDIIDQTGEFVVNIPWPEMKIVTDFVGTTTIREIDKWLETGLTRKSAVNVHPPLIDECPVSLECVVKQSVRLPSHTLFLAEVVGIHADTAVLNERGEVDFDLARKGLVYRSGIVREKPEEKFESTLLKKQLRSWRSKNRDTNEGIENVG